MDDLLVVLKNGSSRKIREALANQPNCPPELILPFVLRKCLQQKHLNLETIKYIKECFGMFTKLPCLDSGDTARAAHIHRLSLITEACSILHNSTNYREAGAHVTMIYKEFMELYKEYKQAKQITYFCMICNRRSRFLKFKKESKTMLANLEKHLISRSLLLLNELIARM